MTTSNQSDAPERIWLDIAEAKAASVFDAAAFATGCMAEYALVTTGSARAAAEEIVNADESNLLEYHPHDRAKQIEAIILRHMSTATPEPLGELKEKQ